MDGANLADGIAGMADDPHVAHQLLDVFAALIAPDKAFGSVFDRTKICFALARR